MTTKKKNLKPKSNKLEKSYNKYFAPRDPSGPVNESTSLQQPSHLKSVDSSTTYGILDDPILRRRIKYA
jgi:hypothetical protein